MDNFFKKIINKRMLFFVLGDALLIVFSVYLAFLIRFDGEIPLEYIEKGFLPQMIVLSLIFCLPVFYFLRLYSFSWAYVSTTELISLFWAVTISFIFLSVSFFTLKTFIGFPRSTIIISYFLVFIFSGALRFAKRIYLHALKIEGVQKERTLIVGAGDAGEQILRSILSSKNSAYLPIGFLDDSSSKQGLTIHGLKVLGKIGDISKITKKHQIENLIIALPSAGSLAIKRSVELGREAGIKKIQIVPSIGEIINGEISIRNIREIQVEDLLGREPIKLDTKAIEGFIRDKSILITGAAGSIGSELSRQAAKFRPSLLILLDQDETGIFNISSELEYKFPHLKINSIVLDIKERDNIEKVFREFKPSIVFHAAAYKHVPLMENQPDEAVRNNIFGTEIVAGSALKFNAEKFIFISTDKAVNPISVMGATKRIGEMICQTLNQRNQTKFISVRFGNVLDTRGSVLPIFREQIKKGKSVEVTHSEMKRYFMITSEAVLLVMQSAEMGKGGEVFVLDMGKPIKIIDLAKEMIRLSGFEPDKDVPIVFTNPRPGEKFFEEILTAEEGTVATQNQRIFMAKLSQVDELKLKDSLENLKRDINYLDKVQIINSLKDIVPQYNPKL
ncbi:MAG: nucleoside-diphosphate sugar epimerase/dehydratase [Candidatus Pacebacteria bacterium]|nr:nucleoside-diphosphate sugar epimerase/dehydratase [Candidatus Paceibacterota bacterium]